MGWDWGHRDYGESVKEYLTENLTWDNERSTSRVLDMTIVKLHTAYAAVERIGKVIGRASPEELAQVVEGLNEIIGT